MIEHRPFATIHHSDYGWLDARYHFSFSSYHDPDRVHWGALRVWNDATFAPGTGFPLHPHQDMEIITYMREGAITHQDSLGNEGRIEAGDIQVMNTGTGISHAEYNMEDGPARAFQIWIFPEERGGAPTWGSKPFPKAERSGRFIALASGMEGDTEALPLRANARVLGATLKAGETAEYHFGDKRYGYLVPSTGKVTVNDMELAERDAAAIRDEAIIRVTAIEDAELVMVDIAAL